MGEAALVLAPFTQNALAALQGIVAVTYESWTDTRKLYSPPELRQRISADGIGILVVEADFVYEEVFQQSGPLKFLGVCRNGLDSVDIEAATYHNVAVVNTPGRNAHGVAELTFGLMLSLARRISHLNGYVKNGHWESPVEPYISMQGIELRGKTLGIIGLGSIGRTVARLGRAFGMHVVAYDPHVGATGSKVAGALLGTLEQVLRLSDFLSIHTPATPDTEGLLDERHLSMMKAGSYIINTASHHVIDQAALVEHIKSGHIAGVGLDVHRTHPILPSSPLLKLHQVILTPHIGGASDGTVERHSWMMVEEIRRFLQGRKPRHLVNREVWRRRG